MFKHKHIALHVQEIKNETKHFFFFTMNRIPKSINERI